MRMTIAATVMLIGLYGVSSSMAHCGSCGADGHAKQADAKKCDPSKCDPSKCDPSKCKDAHAKNVADTDGKTCAKTCDKTAAKVVADGKTCSKTCDKSAAKVVADGKTCSKTCDKTAAKVVADGQCSKSDGSVAKTVADGDKHKYPVAKDTCASSCAEKVVSGTPAMYFMVGDKKTNCPGEANDLAENDASKIKYMVGDETFADKAAAMKAYAGQLDDYLGKISKVSYVIGDETTCCSKSAAAMAEKTSKPIVYRVAMADFDCPDKAAKAAQAAEEAAAKVKMVQLIDGKEYTCGEQAKAACAASGKNASYKIGDVETQCEVTAQVMLLRAKIAAVADAVNAMGPQRADASSVERG